MATEKATVEHLTRYGHNADEVVKTERTANIRIGAQLEAFKNANGILEARCRARDVEREQLGRDAVAAKARIKLLEDSVYERNGIIDQLHKQPWTSSPFEGLLDAGRAYREQMVAATIKCTTCKEKDIAIDNAAARLRWFQDRVAGLEEQARQRGKMVMQFAPLRGQTYELKPKQVDVLVHGPIDHTYQFVGPIGVKLTF